MSNQDDKNEKRQQEIARSAYERYCDRGCTPGADIDDWLTAEREVLANESDEPSSSDQSHPKPRRSRKADQ